MMLHLMNERRSSQVKVLVKWTYYKITDGFGLTIKKLMALLLYVWSQIFIYKLSVSVYKKIRTLSTFTYSDPSWLQKAEESSCHSGRDFLALLGTHQSEPV